MMGDTLKEKLVIVNKLGLHARAAAKFVKLASEFSVDIVVQKDGMDADGKSIMSILMLAAEKGSEITLIVEPGKDQQEAFAALKQLVNDGFGE